MFFLTLSPLISPTNLNFAVTGNSAITPQIINGLVFIVSSSPQDQGEVIIAEHPTFNLGFEVFISPYDEDGPLTADTIHQSIPSLIINEPVETELEDGTAAVRFASDDPCAGRDASNLVHA